MITIINYYTKIIIMQYYTNNFLKINILTLEKIKIST